MPEIQGGLPRPGEDRAGLHDAGIRAPSPAALAACGGNEPAMRGLGFLRPPVSRTAAFPSLVRGTPSFCWPPSFRRKISSLRAPPWAAFFACPPPRRAAGCGRIHQNSLAPPFSHAAAALDPAAMTRGWRARRRARSRWARCTAPPKSFCSRNEADTRWQPAGADRRGGSAPASNRCPHEEKDPRKAKSCRRGIRHRVLLRRFGDLSIMNHSLTLHHGGHASGL